MSDATNIFGAAFQARGHDLRFFFFALALLIYAAFGSPTPDHPSVIEFIIGLGLVLGVGLSSVPLLLGRPDPSCRWLRMLFFYGLGICLIIGLLSANDIHYLMRDIFPFFFVCFPLFFRRLIEETPARKKLFLALCWGLGLVFAARVLGTAHGYLPAGEELFYLANSPVVLFVGVYAGGLAFGALERLTGLRNMLICAACLVASLVCVMAMSLDAQRATIGAIFLSLLILVARDTVYRPLSLIIPLVLIGALAFLFVGDLKELFETLSAKTLAVGLNSRFEEARAVFESAESSLISILFGQGWGAVYHSPAVALQNTPFTHSFLTYVFLKGGLAMLLLALMVLISALARIAGIWQRGERALALALFWALVIPYFLYASHKSLDFGLILLLIYSLGTSYKRNVPNN